MAGVWSAEQNNNYRSRDDERKPMWILRYDPAPGGTKNEDGTTTFQMNFPALQLTEWVAEPEKVAPDLAVMLNAHADLIAALRDAMAGLAYVRQHHGEIYGVGFDRVAEVGAAALVKAGETP